MAEIIPCKRCGTMFSARSKVTKYCAPCRVPAKNEQIKEAKRKERLKRLPPRKCLICGETFTPHQSKQILCGKQSCSTKRNTQTYTEKTRKPEQRKPLCERCKKDKTRLKWFCGDCYSIELVGRPRLKEDRYDRIVIDESVSLKILR